MKLERVGLGYRWDIVNEGVRIVADRITESRGDMSAEVTVQRSPEGHVMRARVNLSSMTARKVIQTSRVWSGSSQRLDVMMELKSLVYGMALRVTANRYGVK